MSLELVWFQIEERIITRPIIMNNRRLFKMIFLSPIIIKNDLKRKNYCVIMYNCNYFL